MGTLTGDSGKKEHPLWNLEDIRAGTLVQYLGSGLTEIPHLPRELFLEVSPSNDLYYFATQDCCRAEIQQEKVYSSIKTCRLVHYCTSISGYEKDVLFVLFFSPCPLSLSTLSVPKT